MKTIRAIKYIIKELNLIRKANNINARYIDIPAKENMVNIFQYHPSRFYRETADVNLGDSLGEVIINFLLKKKHINIDKQISETKHLYCVGTNIQGAYQDATVWGSGIYPPPLQEEN